MNKRNLVFFSVVLATAAIALGVFFFVLPTVLGVIHVMEESPLPEPSKGPQTQAEIDSLIQESMKKLDAAVCQRIENKETQDWCADNVIVTQAVVNKKPELCQTIKSASGKISCEDTILVNQAVREKKPAICDQLKEDWRVSQCKTAVTNPK